MMTKGQKCTTSGTAGLLFQQGVVGQSLPMSTPLVSNQVRNSLKTDYILKATRSNGIPLRSLERNLSS